MRATSFAVKLILLLSLLASWALAQNAANQPPIWSAKPDASAWEQIENNHLASAQRSIEQIVTVKGSHTVANTLQPYDDAIRELDSAAYFAGVMEQVHPDASFRDKATAMHQKVSAAATALSLNQKVYKALAALDLSKSDPVTKYYVQRQLLEFRLAGVDKDDATRAKIKQLRDHLTELQSKFDRNISDDKKTVFATSGKELDGLPEDFIERHKPGADGRIALTTDYPDFIPVLKFAKSDDLRRRLYVAFATRAYPTNREVLMDMLRTRYDIATTVGYPTWADYNAADAMIGTGKKIAEFIQEVDGASRPIADREFQMLLAEKRKTVPTANEMATYEDSYFRELVRRSQYDFDSSSVRPYFPYDRVKKGILSTAEKLFQLTFKQEPDAPSWAPDVETWDVFDHGQMIGRFYLDMHPRQGKYSHAEMASLFDGIRGKQLAEAVLVCNFPAPTATDPGLMEFGDVETFFHEFGHLMHWILAGRLPWAGVSGLNMESDFVEAPSQMLENMLRSPEVLRTFARHYKTGDPIPAELIARFKRAEAFGRALWVRTQNNYTAISYDVYSRKPDTVDPDAVVVQDVHRYTPYQIVPGTHMYASFGHLAGYSSAYYTYLWDRVIAQDFFSKFDPNDPLAGPTPMQYRREVLEPGGSVPANTLVKNFLGRAQNTKAFQSWMSEEFNQPAGKPARNTGK